jgi:hypothetical protein
MPKKHISTLVAFSPWVLSMYILFRLDADAIWTAETANRDVLTSAILFAGMALTFVLLSFFANRRKGEPR